MRNIKRSVALVGSSAMIAAAGIGGLMTAQASTGADSGGNSVVQKDTVKNQGPEGTEANEGPESEEANDGPDVGPDANPNEPGHQDADESGEASQ